MIDPVHVILLKSTIKNHGQKCLKSPKLLPSLIRLVFLLLLLGNPFEYFPHAEMCQHPVNETALLFRAS